MYALFRKRSIVSHMGLSILQHEFGNQIPESPDPSCDSQFTVSLGVFILALGATEVVVYLACSLMAWYVNLTFYAQESLEWIHSDPEYRAQGTSLDIIAQSLQISEHKTSEAREPEPELCCPICLVDYGKELSLCIIVLLPYSGIWSHLVAFLSRRGREGRSWKLPSCIS